MYVVIMAGGKGTRLSSLASDIPKPMIQVCGKPVLEYQIENFIRYGYRDFILVIGHLKQVIKDYFGDGRRIGVSITYFEERTPLGTAGALPYLKNKIGRENFFLINGDIMFNIDLDRFLKFHTLNKALATIIVHPNSHPQDSALVISDKDGKVTNWLHKEEPRTIYRNAVNAGIHIMSGEIFDVFPWPQGKVDLDRDVFRWMLPMGRLYSYHSPEYIKDMGTPERYAAVCRDCEAHYVEKKNLAYKQRAIFLDRDGTINKHCGFLISLNKMELMEGAGEAIRHINNCGYLAIVITNQPVIARGDCSIEGLDEIHKKMETLLGEQGAYLDAIYYCPHHPDRGFPGERPEYKLVCECRKPKPGLIFQAQREFNIDLENSWMVGDSVRDVDAGRNAGCQTAFLGSEGLLGQEMREVSCYPNLYEFARTLVPITE